MHAADFARHMGRINATQRRGKHYQRKAMLALTKRANAALIVPRGHVVGYRLPDGSVACLKQRFRSADTAGAELQRISCHASHSYIPVRAYQCDWCNGWHLTSRPH